MRYCLLTGLAWLCAGMGLCYGLVFEDNCESTSNWEFLDYKADSKVYVTQDVSCPLPYGPTVLHVEGGVVLGLAKDAELSQGTLLVLYKENQPRKEDGDGVILLGAQYGRDISQEHNTKIMRAHVWFEQDNDCGIQYRVIDTRGEERQLKERAGVGLVTDPWNRTGWIWQKVTIAGDTIRAKFWPAEQTEPTEWALEGNYSLQGRRFGLRINSGNIQVAYFAAHTEDITPQIPRTFIFFPQAQTALTDDFPMTLFTNTDQEEKESFVITVCSGRRQLARRRFERTLMPGHDETVFLLSHSETKTDSDVVYIPLKESLPEGVCEVTITSDSGRYDSQGRFEVVGTADDQHRFARARTHINQLGAALERLSKPNDQRSALHVVHDAARAHLDRAQRLLAAGEVETGRRTFRFVTEALGELGGYKGRWLKERDPTWQSQSLPEAVDLNSETASSDQACLDYYSPHSRLRFGKVELEAQSLAMGRRYRVMIPWVVEGSPPERDFDFLVRLGSPLGHRTVASARGGFTQATSQWEPGQVHRQLIELDVLAENAQGRPANPLVLDEYHHLLVTVTDPLTQAHVLLANEPGHHPDRVGQSYLVERLYVSSSPLEIRQFLPRGSSVGHPRQETFILANTGKSDLSIDALFTVTTECDRVICEQALSVTLPGQGQEDISYAWIPQAAGDLTLRVRVLQGGLLRTQSEQAIKISPPHGYDLTVVKEDKVTPKANGFVTPVTIQVGEGLDVPISVKVLALGGIVGKARGAGDRLRVMAEPHFGYYDVQVTLSDFSYDRRIIATVVQVTDGDLLVNGEPFIVKGVNVHGMDASSPERTASMMRIMVDLGFNAWRGDYPALWQVELAYELNTFYSVLAPFSCKSTQTIFTRQAGPPLGTARELTRLFVERYRDSAGVLLWNSANEIQEENIDFLQAVHPVYQAYDPEKRPVHYANLYGQDLWQGQDMMGVNYYFGENQQAKGRQPLIKRSVELGKAHGLPTLFCEYNSYMGAIHSTGVEAMQDLFAWGVEKGGMAGGFLYMKGNSTSHPGVFDAGFNTHAIFNDAIRLAFADARVELVSRQGSQVKLRIVNKRRFTLRHVELHLKASDVTLMPRGLPDLAPAETVELDVILPNTVPGLATMLTGTLDFITHYGFHCKVNIALIAK
jgi:hypothetical protein